MRQSKDQAERVVASPGDNRTRSDTKRPPRNTKEMTQQYFSMPQVEEGQPSFGEQTFFQPRGRPDLAATAVRPDSRNQGKLKVPEKQYIQVTSSLAELPSAYLGR